MELPGKPQLEYRVRPGQYGELVQELTPESEQLYSRYIVEVNMARRAIYEMEKPVEEGN